MIQYLIIEDEKAAGLMLENAIKEQRPEYRLLAITASIIDSVAFLNQKSPDLIFMDIELSDGNCFEIFNQIDINTPIIFTTAYNDYATQAFRVNSIDYILKPIKNAELGAALEKFENHRNVPTTVHDYTSLAEQLYGRNYLNRILIQQPDGYTFVNTDDIAYFSIDETVVHIHTFSGETHMSDYTLNQLEANLNRDNFFRLSRGFLVNIRAIGEIRKHFNWRLKVTINLHSPVEIIVSAARKDDFLSWIGALPE